MEAEDDALKILEALEAESLREHDKLKRKTLDEICCGLFEKTEENRAKATAAIRYLWQHRLIGGVNQGAEMRAWPSEEGLAQLLERRNAHAAAALHAAAIVKANNEWTWERKIKVLGYSATILGVLYGFAKLFVEVVRMICGK